QKNYDSGIYHFCNTGDFTWYEALKLWQSICHFPAEIEKISSTDLKRTAKRPLYSYLLNTKFPAFRSLEASLQDYFLNI
ncbi:MAG TPA: sugar nucleotide-binding protein, partial [Candidatus Gracilibacteria bacterium]|nr:sugar nucleotide-binding protein [Candidatus Gracilibacteria bacterium]